jgi:hypothetical protein
VDPVERIQKIQNELKVDFPYGTEYIRISLTGDNGDELKTLVAAISKAYLKEISENASKARSDRKKNLDQALEGYWRDWQQIHDEINAKAKNLGAVDQKALLFKQASNEQEITALKQSISKARQQLFSYEIEAKFLELTLTTGAQATMRNSAFATSAVAASALQTPGAGAASATCDHSDGTRAPGGFGE